MWQPVSSTAATAGLKDRRGWSLSGIWNWHSDSLDSVRERNALEACTAELRLRQLLLRHTWRAAAAPATSIRGNVSANYRTAGAYSPDAQCSVTITTNCYTTTKVPHPDSLPRTRVARNSLNSGYKDGSDLTRLWSAENAGARRRCRIEFASTPTTCSTI